MTEIRCYIVISDVGRIIQFSQYPDNEVVHMLQNFKITFLRVSVAGRVEAARLSEEDQLIWEDLP